MGFLLGLSVLVGQEPGGGGGLPTLETSKRNRLNEENHAIRHFWSLVCKLRFGSSKPLCVPAWKQSLRHLFSPTLFNDRSAQRPPPCCVTL